MKYRQLKKQAKNKGYDWNFPKTNFSIALMKSYINQSPPSDNSLMSDLIRFREYNNDLDNKGKVVIFI